MPTLKGLIQSAESGNSLLVTQPHVEWLERLEHEQMPSLKAMQYVVRILLRDFKHERSGRFSPSSMGECARRIVFGYAGAPQLPPDIDNQEMMDHGTAAHLKWQIEGLTMGYMTDAEVWVHDEDLLSGGSMDALLHDDSIFELKTAGNFIYNRIVLQERAPKWENLMQVHNYFLLTGADWASVVYEDRSGGQFHEFRIKRDAKIEAEVLRRLRSYKSYVEEDELPPVLDMCEQRIGTQYKRCPYRKICPTVHSVTAASSLHSGEQGRLVPLTDVMPSWAKSLMQMMDQLVELEETS
jgi:hypothetical protein